jgi:RNA polymerase sigma-70 factor (ECF subfamily)
MKMSVPTSFPSSTKYSQSGTFLMIAGMFGLLSSEELRSFPRAGCNLCCPALYPLPQPAAVADRSSRNDPGEARRRLSDALARAGRGSQAALSEVYEATSAKLFGICLRILHDRAEAEDALQDIYLNVWRKAGSFDAERASPITWLATLARNRSIDRLRAAGGGRRSDPVEAALEVADPSPDAASMLETAETGGRLAACLGELEAQRGDAIRTAFFGGVTYAELAERSGVALGTMKSWIRRGLLQLRECMER